MSIAVQGGMTATVPLFEIMRRRLMVLLGDEFDAITLAHRWVAHIGDAAYTMLMGLNRWVNGARRRMGMPYWSLS